MRAGAANLVLVLLAVACTRHTPAEHAAEANRSRPPSLLDGAVAVSAGDAGDAREAGDAGAVEDARGVRDASGPLPPLAGFPKQLELVADHDRLGFVSVPLGAREPRPILIALHGGSDKPEKACAAWRTVTDGYPFVVCPRGWGGVESHLGWRSVADTSERIARAVAATKKAFGVWIRETPSTVLAGFSMGGSQVALLARDQPQTYRRIVVGDTAHDPRPALTFARTWALGGGERAVFLCTTSGCEPSMRAAARNVASEKAPARLNVAATQVHALSEAAVRSMRRDFPWLVEGAEGWETYAPMSDASLEGRTEVFDPQ